MTGQSAGADLIKRHLDVSRETLGRLERFVELLEKWNTSINLVSPKSLPEVWTRHILDSAQLFPLLPSNALRIADIGTGGGFPGLILAVLAKEHAPDRETLLIESDQRKCAFLRTVITSLGLKATVHAERIENSAPANADIVTSRALAPLSQLLGYAERHLRAEGAALLLKGRTAEEEIEEALASWTFELKRIPSKTTDDAVILDVSNLRSR